MCRAADPVVQRLRRLRRKSEPDANERLGFVQSDTVEPVGGDDGFATKPAVQGRVMPGAGGRAPDALNEPSEAFGALCDSLHQEQECAPEDLGTNWDPGADAPALPPQEGRGAKAIERRESERSASDLPSCQQDASLRSASDRLTCQQKVTAMLIGHARLDVSQAFCATFVCCPSAARPAALLLHRDPPGRGGSPNRARHTAPDLEGASLAPSCRSM